MAYHILPLIPMFTWISRYCHILLATAASFWLSVLNTPLILSSSILHNSDLGRSLATLDLPTGQKAHARRLAITHPLALVERMSS